MADGALRWPRAAAAFARVAAAPGVRNAVVRVEVNGDVFEAAAGEARAGMAMASQSRFHLASVAKTFTAALVLQLWERGALGADGLDTPYGQFGVFAPDVLARLHRRGDVSQANEITIRHLLTHTAGIRDAMEDDATQIGGPAPGSLIGAMTRPGGDPFRRWEPWDPRAPEDAQAGVVNWYIANGLGDAALWAPGAAFHYSDTGFMLLGLLAQTLTGEALADLYRTRLIAPLELDQTYLAYRDDPADLGSRREPESEFWGGDMPLLSAGVSLSFDWAGGGLVSTAPSLATFLRGLLAGRLFKNAKTIEAMTNWATPDGLKPPRTGVGLGLFRTAQDGLELIGHSGASGAKMFHAPAHDLTITGTINQSAGPGDWHWAIAQACIDDINGSRT